MFFFLDNEYVEVEVEVEVMNSNMYFILMLCDQLKDLLPVHTEKTIFPSVWRD